MTQSNNQTNTSKMPYCWTMYHVQLLNRQRGGFFFNPDTMRFFKSRLQTLPPYKGRVFVTSERCGWNSPRKYTVRVVRPDGNIDTVYGFQAFQCRQTAHRAAEKYASENFRREGAYSVSLPK